MKKPNAVKSRHVWRGTPIGPATKLPSKAWMYNAICHWALEIAWKHTSLLKREQMKWRYHVFYLQYPEEILAVKIILFPILEILFSTILGTLAILGIISEICRLTEIWYWITKFKMPDRTRYSITYNGGRIEKTILPEDQAKLDKKQRRKEKLEQLKQKRIDKRTLAKH